MTPEFVHSFFDAFEKLTVIGRITLFLSVAVIVSTVSLTVMSAWKNWCDR